VIMTSIFAIGGGDMPEGETEPIDRGILAATGADPPTGRTGASTTCGEW